MMKKEDLVNIISTRLSSQGKETAVAFDVFLQKVAESLEVNQSVKIPDVGIFQLKRKGAPDESASRGKNSYYMLFVPLKYNRKDKNEVLAFQVNPRNIKKTDLDDDVFSLSVGQPVIPVTEQARKDFLVHSSYLLMQKNFEDRVDSLLMNSVNLGDFEIDYNFSAIPEENKFDLAPDSEKETDDNESIPWDFGEEEELIADENKPETPDENADEDFDAIVARITDGISDEIPAFDTPSAEMPEDILSENTEIPEDDDDFEPDPQSETEDVLNGILPEDPVKDPDDLFKDLLGETESPEDEIPGDEIPGKLPDFQANGELGDDWFSLKEIEEEDELPESEEAFSNEEPLASEEPDIIDDQAENIDHKLELLTDMDAGLEIDPFEDFPLTAEEENPEEESLEEESLEEENLEEESLGEAADEAQEEAPADEMPAEVDDLRLDKEGFTGIPMSDEKMLEDEDESEHKVKYTGAFWMILGALVLVTLGGLYYFFFMGKGKLPIPDFVKKDIAAEQAPVKPQIIERDYSVPVTVYKRSTENPRDDQKEASEPQNTEGANNSLGQNNPAVQNNPPVQNNPVDKNKTVPENKTVIENKTNPKAEAPKNVQEKKPENKQPENKLPENKLPENKQQVAKAPVKKLPETNKQALKNNPVVKNTQTTTDVQIQPGSDTKNKLIKEYIFTDGKGRYTIQESSWQSMAEAVKRVKFFRSKGMDAYYTKYAPRGEKVWYRVRIGDYTSLEETENALKRVK